MCNVKCNYDLISVIKIKNSRFLSSSLKKNHYCIFNMLILDCIDFSLQKIVNNKDKFYNHNENFFSRLDELYHVSAA